MSVGAFTPSIYKLISFWIWCC